MLDEVERLDPAKARSLLDDFSNAKAKLYLINRALKLRRRRREVFWEGEYVPLNVKGAFGNDVVAFCRKKAEEYVMVIAPRFVATVTGGVERCLWERFGKIPPFVSQRFAEKLDGRFVGKHFLAGNEPKPGVACCRFAQRFPGGAACFQRG